MADEVVETPEGAGATPDEALGEAGKKALVSEREARKAAEAKAAAEAEAKAALEARLKELEDRDKSESEKAAERLAEAERRAVEVEARAARAEVAAATGVPLEVLAGPKSSSEADLASFAELFNNAVEAAVVAAGSAAPAPLIIPAEGNTPSSLPLNSDGLEAALMAKLGVA